MEIGEFKLNSKVLYDRSEEIKKNPPPEILEYLKGRGIKYSTYADGRVWNI